MSPDGSADGQRPGDALHDGPGDEMQLADGIDIQALIQSAMGDLSGGGDAEGHDHNQGQQTTGNAHDPNNDEHEHGHGQAHEQPQGSGHDDVMDEAALLRMIESASAALGGDKDDGFGDEDSASADQGSHEQTHDVPVEGGSGERQDGPGGEKSADQSSEHENSTEPSAEQSASPTAHNKAQPSANEVAEKTDEPREHHGGHPTEQQNDGPQAQDAHEDIGMDASLQEAIRKALEGVEDHGQPSQDAQQQKQHEEPAAAAGAHDAHNKQHAPVVDAAASIQDAIRATLEDTHGGNQGDSQGHVEHHAEDHAQPGPSDDSLARALSAALGGAHDTGAQEHHDDHDGIDPALREASMEPGIDPALGGASGAPSHGHGDGHGHSHDAVDPSLQALGHEHRQPEQGAQSGQAPSSVEQILGSVDLETAIANLLSAQNQLEEQQQQQQQQQHHHHQQSQSQRSQNHTSRRDRAQDDYGKPGGLSIAETLAITRSQMQKSRQENSNKIDLMLTRKRASAAIPSASTTTFRVQPIPARPLEQQTVSTVQRPERAQSAPAQPEGGDANDSVLAALMLAKQMIEDDGSRGGPSAQESAAHGHDRHDHGRGEHDEDAGVADDATLEALQSALQALGQSLDGVPGGDTAPAEDQQQVQSAANALSVAFASTLTRRRKYRTRGRGGKLTEADKERIRLENRERKKRWREMNNTRNKDNDLRLRIIRRAQQLFGDGDSDKKTAWIDDEFAKRRSRRIEREMEQARKFSGADIGGMNGNGGGGGGLSLDADELRSALQMITGDAGASSSSSELDSLTDAVNNLIRDPSILESLGSMIGANTTTTATTAAAPQPRHGPADLNERPLHNGALITSFKLSSTPSGRPQPSRQHALPRYPSRMPDPGLTSLVRANGRKIPRVGSRGRRAASTSAPAANAIQHQHQHQHQHQQIHDPALAAHDALSAVFDDAHGGLHYDDSDRTIQELAGIISEAVRAEAQNEAAARKRKHSDMVASSSSPPPQPSSHARVTAGVVPEHLLSSSVVVPSPRPPQYKPPAVSHPSTPQQTPAKDAPASSRAAGREDKHVKAMGFPPALTGLAVPR